MKVMRSVAVKAGKVKTGDGKDLDHKVPLSKGGSNKPSNLRVSTPSANRSFPRKKDGSMK
jgi:5-methylcytosine-specific restriction endonuclease McrA